ncbi:hypothetical protein GCK32_006144, partial [Trichostrongylus colubriformis]
FRFLEALRLGCIPVVLSDDWVLPFDEIIDWSAAAVIVPEDSVLLVLDILYTYTPEKIFQMKQRGFFLYYRYFSSVEKIAVTALEIVWERIRISQALNRRIWNHFQFSDTSVVLRDVTVVISAAEKPSSRLQKTVSVIAVMDGLSKVIVLWPRKRGVPPIGADFGVKTPLMFIESSELGVDVDCIRDAIGDGFIVYLDERLSVPLPEVTKLLEYAQRNPLRLIGVHGIEFDWQKEQVVIGRVYNALLFSLVAFHSYYLKENVSPIPSALWNQCLHAVLNVAITERSMASPMVIGSRLAAPSAREFARWQNYERGEAGTGLISDAGPAWGRGLGDVNIATGLGVQTPVGGLGIRRDFDLAFGGSGRSGGRAFGFGNGHQRQTGSAPWAWP